MRRWIRVVAPVILMWPVAAAAQLAPLLPTDPPCAVTAPNGVAAGSAEHQEGSHGNAFLSTGLGPKGTIIFTSNGPGFVTPDGALGMKFLWVRGIAGKLFVVGRRLDGQAGPLRFEAPNMRDTGFQASYLIFPTEGCWEVSARVGDREDSKLTFITRVVKLGDGPKWVRSESR